jgi:ATP dependent DNA ligase domain
MRHALANGAISFGLVTRPRRRAAHDSCCAALRFTVLRRFRPPIHNQGDVTVTITPPVAPMLALAVPQLPGPAALPGGTVFEPKYDGYRMLVFAHAGHVYLQSRNLRELTSLFPEIAEAAAALGEDVVLDGEAVIHPSGRLDFTALQKRMGRRPGTVAQLAAKQPAHFIAFDLLELEGTQMLNWPYRERRAALESLFQGHGLHAPWALTPPTADHRQAERWLQKRAGTGVEGVVAKGADQPYLPGRRGWRKIRARNTAEAIIGAVTGLFTHPTTLLLGRYTSSGGLRLVARSMPLSPPLQRELGRLLSPAGREHPWQDVRISSQGGSREPLSFTCVAPHFVAEFLGETAIGADRWRHPVQVQRIRTDLAPQDVPATDENPEPAP